MKLIDALESHVTTMRGTLKKKKKVSVSIENQNMRPRASSIAVEVRNTSAHSEENIYVCIILF